MAKTNDKITYKTDIVTIDHETGEVLKEETATHIRISSEPNYIKLYINTLLAFKDLPKTLNPILLEFLTYMTYADIGSKRGGQIIMTNSYMKKNIAENLNLTLDSINKGLFKLEKAKIFKRIDLGTYQVNPHLFGKGEWKDIKAIRATFDFNNGEIKTDFQTEVEDDTNSWNNDNDLKHAQCT